MIRKREMLKVMQSHQRSLRRSKNVNKSSILCIVLPCNSFYLKIMLSNVMNKWFSHQHSTRVYTTLKNLIPRLTVKSCLRRALIRHFESYLCWISFQFIRFAFRLNLLPVQRIYYLSDFFLRLSDSRVETKLIEAAYFD